MREPVEGRGNEAAFSQAAEAHGVSGGTPHHRYRAFLSYSHQADSQFAPILQSSIEQLGKPWYRRRALSVFRDDTDLAVSPHLWPTIEEALNDSDYLLLLACPQAAAAEGVRNEISHWTDRLHRDSSRILIAVTGGSLAWSETDQNFDWSETTALPSELKEYFRGRPEPLWADFSSAKAENRLRLEDATFRRAAVKLAAGLHGIAPRDLESEDLRQHRKTIRIATAFSAGLLVLLVGVVLLFLDARRQRIEADRQRNEANTQRNEAVKQRNEAERQKNEADSQRNEADKQRNEAETRGRVAESRALAVQAMDRSDKRLDVALLLGVASHRLADTVESRKAMLKSVLASAHIARFLHATGTIECLVFHPTRPTLVAAAGGSVLAWNTAAGSAPRRVGRTGEPCKAVTFLDSGARLAVVTESGKLFIWDFDKGSPIASAGEDNPMLATVTPAGEIKPMVAVIDGASVVVWDLRTRTVRSRVPAPLESPVLAVALSPTEDILAVASRRFGIRLWDMKENRYRSTRFEGHRGPVTALAFSPNGEVLASGSEDQSVILWETATGMVRREMVKQGWASDMRFSPDGQYLAWCSFQGRLQVFNLQAEERLRISDDIVTSPTPSMAFSPDSRNLAVGTAAGGQVVELDLLHENSTVAVQTAHRERIIGLAASPDGRFVVSGSADGELIFWDTATKRIANRYQVRAGIGRSIEFNPDGRTLITLTSRGEALIWHVDAAKLTPSGAIRMSSGSIRVLAFSPDGQTLAFGGDKGRLLTWEMGALDRSRPRLFASSGENITALEFAPKGDALAIGYDNGKIHVINRKGANVSEFAAGRNPVSALKFSQEGDRLYSASEEGVVVWNIRLHSPIGAPLNLGRHGANVIAMSRDGKLIASGSSDNSVALWDAELRVLLGSLPIPGSSAFSLAFAPSGEFLAVGVGYEISRSNSVLFWDLAPRTLVRRSCEIAGRNLLPEEWVRYAGDATPQETCR